MDFAKRVTQVRNVAEVIADTVAELIYSAQLKPGQFLRQEEMARQFMVSRVPVRDALHILERRGLVVTVPRRGVQVRPISRKQVEDLYDLRRALEVFAVRQALGKFTADDLAVVRDIIAKQRAAIESQDLTAYIAGDEEFHLKICSLAGNKELLEAIVNVWSRIKQIRSVALVDSDWGHSWAARSVERHEQLLNAITGDDPENAVVVLDTIIQDAAVESLKQLEKLGWLENESKDTDE